MNFPIIQKWTAILLLVLLGGCTKKNDSVAPLSVRPGSRSMLRLINLNTTTAELAIDGIQLSSFDKDQAGLGYPTLAFPGTGKWNVGEGIFGSVPAGNPFPVPDSVILHNNARIQVYGAYSGGLNPLHDSVFNYDVNQPLDVYYYSSAYFSGANGRLAARVFPRDIQSSSSFGKFKIRLINLSSPNAPNSYGNLTLTGSDRGPVDPLTSGIAPGNYSPYIELPYGTYNFKLLDDHGQQVPENYEQAHTTAFYRGNLQTDPNTNLLVGAGMPFAGSRTFQPGGIYTIVTGLFQLDPLTNNNNTTVDVRNSYQVITDLSGSNTQLARLQAVNAVIGQNPITLKIDGQPVGGALNFGGHSDYSILYAGIHVLTAEDASGNTLSTQQASFYPMENKTAWCYQKDGQTHIALTNNDLSQSYKDPYSIYGYSLSQFDWQSRFINLSPDAPYASFTNDGSPFANFSANTLYYFGPYGQKAEYLQPGQVIDSFPYIMFPGGYGRFLTGAGYPVRIKVYLTNRPGNSFTSLSPPQAALTLDNPGNHMYVQDTTLYAGGSIPRVEPGVYTTALIGSVDPAAKPGDRARLLVIKHIK